MHLSNKALLAVLTMCVMGLLAAGCGGCEGESTTGQDQQRDDAGLCLGDGCADALDTSPDDDTSGSDTGVDSNDEEDSGSDADICPPANECAAECCTDGQLCLNDTCVEPGADCTHNLECDGGEICEPTLAKCIPNSGQTCEWRPPTEVFEPKVDLAWRDDANTVEPAYNQVMMTPAVIDITDSGTPDIVFSTFTGGNYNAESVLRAIDGRTYDPIFDLADPAKRVSGSASLAIGDIDSDGRNEIVAVRPGASGLIVFDDHTTDWAIKWETGDFPMSWDGATLVDLDANGTVEVVAANRVYNGTTGELECVASGISASPSNSVAVDLDGDGNQEVVAANGAFKFVADGQGGFDCPVYFTYEGASGFPAVGDFGTFSNGERLFGQFDGKPEIVTVNTSASDQVALSNGQTGELIWSATLPTTGHPHFSDTQCSAATGAGAPTVADFDGDGVPEVATAGACYYLVYETDGSLKWKAPTQDFSSRITGSSVFDFQGDGKAEVVYADECFIYVYDGTGNDDGTTDVLFKRAHTSGTTRELPVVVDVNADYHANIVVISNDYSGVGNRCRTYWPDFDNLGGEERGILVLADEQNRWVSTRPVWNEHAYHVTNVCDGMDDQLCPGRVNKAGAIPIGKKNNWEISHLNNFRQNVQGSGLFNAPDLVISNIKTTCGGDGLELSLTVANQGSRGVGPGVDIGVWVTIAGNEDYLTTLTTTVDLPPGGRETLTYQWADAPDPAGQTISVRAVADTNEAGDSQHNECVEDNNETVNEARCACEEMSDCNPGEYCTTAGQCLPIDG
jgi:hypothetical protein